MLLDLLSVSPIVYGCVAAVAAFLVLCFVIVMVNRKKAPKDTVTDRNLIETNANKVEVLITIAGDNAETVESLKKLQEKLRFLPPVRDERAFAIDNKIKNLIDDLKIALTKSGGEDSKKTENIFKDIDVLIAERGAVVNL